MTEGLNPQEYKRLKDAGQVKLEAPKKAEPKNEAKAEAGAKGGAKKAAKK